MNYAFINYLLLLFLILLCLIKINLNTNIIISALTAETTQGITNLLNNMTNGAITVGNASNATLTQKFTTSLYESAISTTTNTALQSTINGDSFKDTLKHQVVNSLVMTGAEYGANSIGTAYHNNSFSNNNFVNKATQLTLHAGLGAITSKLMGGDYLSGAVAGVSAEVVAELYGNAKYGTTNGNLLTQDQKDVLKNIGGLAGGLSAIITAKSQGKDVKDIGNEAYAGQRVGENAVENNLIMYIHGTWSDPTTFSDEFKESVRRLTGDDKEVNIQWSGDNTKEARTEGANKLLETINNYKFAENEPLIFVAHSHGGNVVKEYSNMINNNEIIGANGTRPSTTMVINFATPNRSDYVMKDGVFDKYYNIYNTEDKLTQKTFGGIDTPLKFNSILDFNIFDFNGIPTQKTNEAGAINIPITINNTYKYTNNDFNNLLKPNGDTIENYFNLMFDISKGQIENHTEIKTPETINTIYNYNANKYNEIQNNLQKYNNFMNFINNKK